MSKKKRKYTKGPAWFKAHSPKALSARKKQLVRTPASKYKIGDSVSNAGQQNWGTIIGAIGKWWKVKDREGMVHEMTSDKLDRIAQSTTYYMPHRDIPLHKSDVGDLMGLIDADIRQRNSQELEDWRKAFPNITPTQAKRMVEQLENDRVTVSDLYNKALPELTKLRSVNKKLLSILTEVM